MPPLPSPEPSRSPRLISSLRGYAIPSLLPHRPPPPAPARGRRPPAPSRLPAAAPPAPPHSALWAPRPKPHLACPLGRLDATPSLPLPAPARSAPRPARPPRCPGACSVAHPPWEQFVLRGAVSPHLPISRLPPLLAAATLPLRHHCRADPAPPRMSRAVIRK